MLSFAPGQGLQGQTCNGLFYGHPLFYGCVATPVYYPAQVADSLIEGDIWQRHLFWKFWEL